MPGLQIIITKAGRAALVNAEHNGTAPLKIAEIGVTAAVFIANEDATTLPGEIKRLSTISGEVVAPDTIHVTIRDDGTDTYTVRGIGYWLSNGVLLGVYSQPDPILQKSTQSMMLLAADTVFTTLAATSLTFGDTNFTNPPATVDRQGVVELATVEETKAGKDATRAVTPAGLKPAMVQVIADHKAEADPHREYLTIERGNALLKNYLPLTGGSVSGQLQVSGSIGAIGSDGPGRPTIEVMSKDKADHAYMTFHRPGAFAVHFGLDANNDLSVGGYSMGANAYKLWHAGNFNPAAKQDALGYTPVQQGTGVGQLPNVVKIGWSNGSGVKVTVDATDMGTVVFGRQRINLNWNGIGGQPVWMLGGNTPDDVNVYNPANFSVNYANSANYASNAGTATYATQLTGQGLQNHCIGGYILNKNHTSPEAAGAWELRGYAYDYGSGGDGGTWTRTALWQRVA
ncbi:hypothetical protein [Collimonas silvisoli]|uniref:hypothetical protein n=1 Tax=Collimonas silvisoli TaxID=2825884 RepID=UPI001B8B23C4|nr:hypothetical protein [Collimonas silvisoli]